MAATLGETLADRVRARHLRDYEGGEVVYAAGGSGQVYLVVSGAVEILREDHSGPRSRERFEAGGLFGDLAAVGSNRRDVARARVATRLLRVDVATFEQICVDRPKLGLRIIRSLSEQLGQAQQRCDPERDVVTPLLSVLPALATPDIAGVRIRTTLRELAERAGLSMRDAHRGLQVLFERKLLRLTGDELMAVSLESLQAGLPPRS